MSSAAPSTSGARPQKPQLADDDESGFFLFEGKEGAGDRVAKIRVQGGGALGFLGVEEVQCNNPPKKGGGECKRGYQVDQHTGSFRTFL